MGPATRDDDAPARASVTVFVKQPTAGTVKTRLAASIGAQAAAAFYTACAEHVVAAAVATPGVAVTIAFAPRGAGDAVRSWLAPCLGGAAVTYEPQVENPDLGVRMQAALACGLAVCGKAAIIGSDVPGITPAAITAALDALPSSPPSPPASLVLGPALDGGYWLVACTAAPATLFARARWSTANAAADTRAAAAACGVVVVDGDGEVPTLADVDTVQDLSAWRATAAPDHPLLPAADAALASAPRSTMRLKLLLFARARELAGVSETSLEVEPGATTANLQATILSAFPALAEIEDAIVLAVNQQYVDASAGEQLLAEGDEVAVIPPISGG